MKKEVVSTIRGALKRTIEILDIREEKDVAELKELSNDIIRCSSVYQDIDSVSAALLIYSLYKIFDRKVKVTQLQYNKILNSFKEAHEGIKRSDLKKYNRSVSALFETLKKLDKSSYLQKIFEKASINKGSVLVSHGLSIKRAAEIMHVSEWQLSEYVGKTRYEEIETAVTPKTRLEHATGVFE